MSDKNMPDQKRKRSANWDDAEKEILKRLILENIDVIEDKDVTTNSNGRKKEAWKQVLDRFNKLNCRPRDLPQMQKQWQNMKMATKKVLCDHKKASKKTGGGPRPPSPSPEDLKMVELMPDEFAVDSNRFDSNNHAENDMCIDQSMITQVSADDWTTDGRLEDLADCSVVADHQSYTLVGTTVHFLDRMEEEMGKLDEPAESTPRVNKPRVPKTRPTKIFNNKSDKLEDALKRQLFELQKKHLDAREAREVEIHQQNRIQHEKKLILLDLKLENKMLKKKLLLKKLNEDVL